MPDKRARRFTAARKDAMRAKNRIAKENYLAIRDLLKQSNDRIRATLAAQPSDYQLWALPTLQREIQATMDSLATTASTTAQSGWDDEWLAGQRTIDDPLRAGGITLRAPKISPRQLIAMREFLTDRIKDISRIAKRRINSELGLIITGIQSPGEAISNVTRLLNETSRRRALTIVRTELGRAFSAAQSARMQQAKAHVPGLMKQWRRSGKIHSRIQHDTADGQLRAPDQPFDVAGYKLMYPRDPAAPPGQTINCGCDSLPYMQHWDVKHPNRQPFTTDEIARDPRRADLVGNTAPLSKTAVRQHLQSTSFRHFAAGQTGFPDQERTVAIIDKNRLKQLGLGHTARTVHLSQATVLTHPRFADLTTQDWLRVQTIVDQGQWRARGTHHRLLWTTENNKPWLTVLKRTNKDEIYLSSYRRARMRDIEKLQNEL